MTELLSVFISGTEEKSAVTFPLAISGPCGNSACIPSGENEAFKQFA